MLRTLFRNFFPHEQSPESTESAIARSRQLLEVNQPEQAILALDPILARDANHAEGRFLRGTARLELQRADEAMDDLQRAAILAPREPKYLYNLALAHWTLGDMIKARELCHTISGMADFRPAHVLLSNMHLRGEFYLAVMQRIHAYLKPATYVEIGVFRGESLQIVRPETMVIGVDPAPQLEKPAGSNQRIFEETSDDFFAHHDVISELGNRRIELAFIDGMHQFDFALRDFINLERLSNPGSVILVHDCFPVDYHTSQRQRSTCFWSGDTWRLILILRKYRPDLAVHTITAPPTGLGMIFNLDPSSRVLSDNIDTIIAEYLAVDYTRVDERKDEMLNTCTNEWAVIRALLDGRTPN